MNEKYQEALGKCCLLVEKARELKALFWCKSGKVVTLNKIRTLTHIDTMIELLEGLKEIVEPLDARGVE